MLGSFVAILCPYPINGNASMNANFFTAFQQSLTVASTRAAFRPATHSMVSYGDLRTRTARLAGSLRALGTGPGDRIAVQVEKSIENVVLYLACLQIGAIYLPLNTAYTDNELSYFFDDAEPSLIVCQASRREGIEKLVSDDAFIRTLDTSGDGSLVEHTLSSEPDFEITPRQANDIAAILYTSGTTGRSKGAMVTHGNLQANATTLIDAWEISSNDTLLHALPIYHVHGLFVALNTCLIAGAEILFHPKFDTDAVLDALPNATLMMGVPTFYTRMLSSDRLNPALCEDMRLFIAGSAPLLEETFRTFERRTGHAILERYGMTECGMLCSNPLKGARRPGTVGPPLADVEVRVADEQGTVLPKGEIGVLEVCGPNVFKGYWRMPEKTDAEFRKDGFFITGDVSRIDDDGYVHIVGRAKDMIISGGFNVYPKEIEDVIDQVDGIGESAVIGLTHPDFGEAVTAVITATANSHIEEETIIAATKKKLAAFKVPKAIFIVDELPRNAMGKVQKNLLRERYRSTFN